MRWIIPMSYYTYQNKFKTNIWRQNFDKFRLYPIYKGISVRRRLRNNRWFLILIWGRPVRHNDKLNFMLRTQSNLSSVTHRNDIKIILCKLICRKGLNGTCFKYISLLIDFFLANQLFIYGIRSFRIQIDHIIINMSFLMLLTAQRTMWNVDLCRVHPEPE